MLILVMIEGAAMPISNPSLPSVPDGVQVDDLKLDAAGLTITARTRANEVACPVCGRLSARVHSSYWRTLHDLPWQDRAVTWRVRIRRFRCDHCPGRIFAERLPGLANARTRRSDRLAEAQTDIGMVLGGEAGARLSRRLAMPVSGDTVLRLIGRRGILLSPSPRVVGIDDSAWQRGRRYGMIVCDLEPHRVIDLLPGRSSTPVRDCLAAHPSVTVVSSDRSGPYCRGRTARRAGGDPRSGDRWHLLVNASEALRALVERHQPEIRDAARQSAPTFQAPTPIVEADPRLSKGGGQRRARCETALRLHGEGLSIKAIARNLGASRNNVRRWVRSGAFVPYRRAPGPGRLDRFRPFIEERWQDGQRNSAALYRDLQALGFDGGYDIVQRWAIRRRQRMQVRSPSARIPSTRRITRWLTSDTARLSPEDRRSVEVLRAIAPKLSVAAEHVRAFREILSQGEPPDLELWLEAAAATDLSGFVAGLRQDQDAVRAAIAEP